jgi:hypothetical protein
MIFPALASLTYSYFRFRGGSRLGIKRRGVLGSVSAGLTYRTAVCGSACTVVWQGRTGDRPPMPICYDLAQLPYLLPKVKFTPAKYLKLFWWVETPAT